MGDRHEAVSLHPAQGEPLRARQLHVPLWQPIGVVEGKIRLKPSKQEVISSWHTVRRSYFFFFCAAALAAFAEFAASAAAFSSWLTCTRSCLAFSA